MVVAAVLLLPLGQMQALHHACVQSTFLVAPVSLHALADSLQARLDPKVLAPTLMNAHIGSHRDRLVV